MQPMAIQSSGLRRFRWRNLAASALVSLFSVGCATVDWGDKEVQYLGEERPLQDYEEQSTKIEHPLVHSETPEPVAFSQKPRVLTDRTRDEVWDMPLAEAVHLALKNNKIVRTRNDFLTGGSQVFTNPDNVNSIYDPAIRESGILFGGRGVESALAAFDTQLTTRMLWGANSNVQNQNFLFGSVPPGQSLDQDTATFSTGLTKQFAYGASAGVTHNWNYNWSNQPNRLYNSAYDGAVQLNYRQPLWAGAGPEFTRIAGPIGDNIQGLSGVNQGVLIARINTDITVADFEISVRNMLRDVEDLYWDLYLAYRSYDSEVVARNSALRTWREVKARTDVGAKGGGAADEAQARETYFDARSRSENTLQNLYSLELQMRRLLGLPANDGRIIRPSDEPTTAELVPEWHLCLAESLTKREELRRQKWNIKSLELQLTAAKNLANPRLDFVSNYQLNGFGDRLFSDSGAGESTPEGEYRSAYRSLARAQQTGYNMGVEFSMPLGLRNATAQVRNQELRLVKAKEVLALQELEISHELANAFQTLAWRYQTAQTNFNRRRAAERQRQAFEAEYRAGTKTLDLLLQAQTRLANAEIQYYTSLVNYNKALTDLHLRKGSLLQNNNVHLAEGMWSPEAYKDALRRAWARTYSAEVPEFDPVDTFPDPFSSDQPVQSSIHSTGTVLGEMPPEESGMLAPEPTPAPVPQDAPGDSLPKDGGTKPYDESLPGNAIPTDAIPNEPLTPAEPAKGPTAEEEIPGISTSKRTRTPWRTESKPPAAAKPRSSLDVSRR
jgi:outer membrane protein TolC